MLLTATKQVPCGDFIFQRKWDGVRMLGFVERGLVALQNRQLNLRTGHYPELAVLAIALKAGAAVLDGEVVVLREGGHTSFPAVLRRERAIDLLAARKLMQVEPVHYMVFDMLSLDGGTITHLPLEERIGLLRENVSRDVNLVQVVDSYADGKALYEATKRMGIEGIVAKEKGSPYLIGKKTSAWQKIKHTLREQFPVVGYTMRAGQVNALVLATTTEDSGSHLCGRVGSGLTNEHIRLLTKELPKLALPHASQGFPADATAVHPVLLADVEFMEWTEALKIRAPVIKGFASRSDTNAR